MLTPGVYLHLSHGRTSPDEQLNDWGFNGPTIGPLEYVHHTYAVHVRFYFRDLADAHRQGFVDTEGELYIVDGLLVHDGKYYGDWTVSDSPER